MDNKVYYGEYSLQHWIDLILKKNLILPEYQRYFVWNEKKVETLIKTFKTKQFVPPVTIGAFKSEHKNQNLILDGQQRLTSIILSHLGLFPDEATFKIKKSERYADENDDEEEEGEQLDNIFEWTLEALTKKGNNKQDILKKITEGNYKRIDLNIDDDFLKNTFLGFSYLVPNISDGKQQQKYYSSVFRNINIQGDPLLLQESRESLYFLDSTLSQFFNPNFCKNISIKSFGNETKIDFVRYLSLLSQYKKDGDASKIARGYKPKMEAYYEEYIYSVIGENTSPMFANFLTIFPNKKYQPLIEHLSETITNLEIPKQFGSIIELDIYLFGLINSVVFEGKKIPPSTKVALKQELAEKTKEIRDDSSHTRAPSALKYLRHRIDTSVKVYKKYAHA